jgi:hypothetical protein
MGFASATIGVATCVLAPGGFAIHQRDCTNGLTRSNDDGNSFSTYQVRCLHRIHGQGLRTCMARGFFNITGVTCDCNQRNTPGAPWECVATATCKK